MEDSHRKASTDHSDRSAQQSRGSSGINPILRDHNVISKDISRVDSFIDDPDYNRPSLHALATVEFYQTAGWMEGFCEALFKVKKRKTTIKAEFYHGIIHFISCLYCLAVVPQQMSSAGYDSSTVVSAVAILCGIGSIFCGLLSNLPFVLAPPTVVTIFLSVYLQQHNIGPRQGNYGVLISGFCLMFFFYRPLGEFVKHLIPIPIQVGTVVGIGLMTTLAGSTEIELVIAGHYKILRMGHLTPEIIISITGVIIICVTMRYHIKGSFCIAVLFCSVVYWIHFRAFPDQIFAVPNVTTAYFGDGGKHTDLPLMTIDLLFLYVLYLNGLLTSLSNLAVLTRGDNTIPRGRWIFILSGFFTVIGGLLTTAPILVSPESAAAIKEGAKTGLSTVVCGFLFLVASFFSPLFKRIPAAGTSPVLIMIGLVLFQNVNRIDWRNVADAAPAFVVLFYIPFTYSIIQGVILGYVMYVAITICTGEFLENTLYLLLTYFPDLEEPLKRYPVLAPYMPVIIGPDEDYPGDTKDDNSIAGDSVLAPGGGNRSRSGSQARSTVGRNDSTGGSFKVKDSRHDQGSVLEAFADMNPALSFSDPADRPPKILKSVSSKASMARNTNTTADGVSLSAHHRSESVSSSVYGDGDGDGEGNVHTLDGAVKEDYIA